MKTETPRTDDAQFGTGRVSVEFARTLERELAEAQNEIKILQGVLDRYQAVVREVSEKGRSSTIEILMTQRDRLTEALRETIPLFNFGFLTIEEKGKVKSAFKTLAAAENTPEK